VLELRYARHEKQNDYEPQSIFARDSRNRKIPGSQIRKGKYYGYLWSETESGKWTPRRFPLSNEEDGQPCSNTAEAKAAFDILKTGNKLPPRAGSQTFNPGRTST